MTGVSGERLAYVTSERVHTYTLHRGSRLLTLRKGKEGNQQHTRTEQVAISKPSQCNDGVQRETGEERERLYS